MTDGLDPLDFFPTEKVGKISTVAVIEKFVFRRPTRPRSPCLPAGHSSSSFFALERSPCCLRTAGRVWRRPTFTGSLASVLPKTMSGQGSNREYQSEATHHMQVWQAVVLPWCRRRHISEIAQRYSGTLSDSTKLDGCRVRFHPS